MSTTQISESKLKQVRTIIIIASIAIPVVVAVLFKVQIPGLETKVRILPTIYAIINGLTALLLIGALVAVKQKKIKLHESLIKVCMFLSIIFLALYVAYHMCSKPTLYGDSNFDGSVSLMEKAAVGNSSLIYYFILISHILLSVSVVPMVLFSYLFAWQGNIAKHRRWTVFTWPIWFYVASTGVIVYYMISPYYKG
jgi:putative membrane protein